MKSTTAGALVALFLINTSHAAPGVQPERRQFSIPGLGSSATLALPTGLFPTALPIPTGLESGNSGSLPVLTERADSSTDNDIVDNTGCTSLTVIFARGTSESGNVGTIAGPPMLSAIESSLGTTITKQGVDYPASVEGNADLGADGGPTMKSLVDQSISQCPDSKIILSGYSQGAMVVHNAAGQSGFQATKVSGAVLFGDPFNGQSVSGIASGSVKEFCASGDDVCNGDGFAITPAHLTYGSDASDAATFAIQAAGL